MSTDPIDVRDRGCYDLDQFRVPAYRDDLEGILVSAGEIRNRVARLAAAVTEAYRGRPFYPVCVLKGAMRFFAALLDRVTLDAPFGEGLLRSSRYDGDATSTAVEIDVQDPDAVAGKDVLIVEDIVDEGHTLAALRERLADLGAASVAAAVLFDKVACRTVDVDVEFTGFCIPDEFVVGYGLDYDERYRDLPHLGVVDPDSV